MLCFVMSPYNPQRMMVERECKSGSALAALREAIEERAAKEKAAEDEPKRDLVAEFRKLRESMPALSNEEIRKAREEGRP